MKYSIPTAKIEKLEKIIKRANKKGANITFEKGNTVFEKGTLYIEDNINHQSTNVEIEVECVEVFVEGSYKINGWNFVGVVEFTPNGNIIRFADSSYEDSVPSKYLHTPKICEHCGKIRNRKDTYLIVSDEGEWKQVGSTCLLDYTKGLDADMCASIMSCLDQIKTLEDYDNISSDMFIGNCYDTTGYSLPSEMVLPAAYDLVKSFGYQRIAAGKGTAYDIMTAISTGTYREPEQEELDAITEYAKCFIDGPVGYMRNASLAWLKSSIEFRDFSLIASFVNTYFKEQERLARERARVAERNNEYVGNVGDKITFKVKSARVLYVKDNNHISYYAASQLVWEIIDTENHTFKLNTKLDVEINEGDSIVATIKEHTEYRGIKQTILTRGKIN